MNPIDPSRRTDLEALARRRVARKMGFFIHATVYVLVNLGLVAIDLLSGGHDHWSRFPLLGWGLGLAIHGVVTFAGSYGDGLQRRMLQRELERCAAAAAEAAGAAGQRRPSQRPSPCSQRSSRRCSQRCQPQRWNSG